MDQPLEDQPLQDGPRPNTRRTASASQRESIRKSASEYQRLLTDISTSDDSTIRSTAREHLLQLTLSTPTSCRVSTIREDIFTTCCRLNITPHSHWDTWRLPETGQPTANPLSQDVESIMFKLKDKYYRARNSKASARVIAEILILDRLSHLADDVLKLLHLCPEVDLSLSVGNTDFTGRVGCVICHDEESKPQSALVAIEFMRPDEFSYGHSQMAVYLAAIQAAQAGSHEPYPGVGGILTDSHLFQFMFLGSNQELFVSDMLNWNLCKSQIITWIDKILTDSIAASPLATPILRHNISLRNQERALRGGNLISGNPHNSSESFEDPLSQYRHLNLVPVNTSETAGIRWYRGDGVVVFEYDVSDDEVDS